MYVLDIAKRNNHLEIIKLLSPITPPEKVQTLEFIRESIGFRQELVELKNPSLAPSTSTPQEWGN